MDPDLEATGGEHAFLMNETVHSFAWKGVSVTVKDHETKKPKTILENSSGHVNPGMYYTYNIFYMPTIKRI